jgi:starvation-inducible outer membrane lipoprotein
MIVCKKRTLKQKEAKELSIQLVGGFEDESSWREREWYDPGINKYTENKAKQNYDYDFASSNANSYELWMKQRHEIKQKRILAKTVTWLLDNLNILETKRFGQN